MGGVSQASTCGSFEFRADVIQSPRDDFNLPDPSGTGKCNLKSANTVSMMSMIRIVML